MSVVHSAYISGRNDQSVGIERNMNPYITNPSYYTTKEKVDQIEAWYRGWDDAESLQQVTAENVKIRILLQRILDDPPFWKKSVLEQIREILGSED